MNRFLNPHPRARNRRAFTLLELIVVLVVLGLLAAVAIPVYSAVHDRAALRVHRDGDQHIINAIVATHTADRDAPLSNVVETVLDETPVTATPAVGELAASGEWTITEGADPTASTDRNHFVWSLDGNTITTGTRHDAERVVVCTAQLRGRSSNCVVNGADSPTTPTSTTTVPEAPDPAYGVWTTSFTSPELIGSAVALTPTPMGFLNDLPAQVTDVSTSSVGVACWVAHGAASCVGLDSPALEAGLGAFLGRGAPVPGFALTAAPVAGLESGVTAVRSGRNGSCAIHNGGVKCWGGRGVVPLPEVAGSDLAPENGYSATPVQVPGLTSGVTALAVGDNHACAIQSGAVRCWGSNRNGQLGNGTATPTPQGNSWEATNNVVTPVGFGSGVTAVATSAGSTCVVRNGALSCWGSAKGWFEWDNTGTYVDGWRTWVGTPRTVPGLEAGVTDVTLSTNILEDYINAACVVQNGGVKCWGNNGHATGAGEGVGCVPFTQCEVFTEPSGLGSGVSSVVTNGHATCAVQNGGAKCWGAGSDPAWGGSSFSATPVPVAALEHGVERIGALAMSNIPLFLTG